ncbi:MAG: Fe(3+) ABC transporter substrate-binding protein [Candidatus Puniceispirillum sp.]|uniref:Fe(3+) ABC transporter substrate-binding protein n=1 Tax=Candidatus Puniceispirillum sp. TaxID=2026719 RepID=UPI001EC44A36|nr:Fe(3+) ABC transporter substrate-binding protein [Candidatus Puniceispirillum sp.]MBT6414950.1 Fe(3+) ABC transporter substrate-binding protein [Candidatus Puniceispirillum sp.]MBT6566936.1 Fe(3+) ABC transporter substrate-binding protein [Candidatus Puniceispirillum sp.]
MKTYLSRFIIKLAMMGVIVFGHAASYASELNIYSHRQAFLITPFLDAFTAETGIKTNVVFASKGLAQRLATEGANSPADLVLTVDIARLSVYAEKGLFAPVQSDVLHQVIPEHLRSKDGTWFGLSKRSRIVGVSKARVADGAVLRIEDLADTKWRGKICSRPGSHVYNRALVASMIAAHGEVKAEAWARNLVANFARRPQGNDRAQVKAIFEGQCDIAILNHYYFGKLLNSDDAAHREWADSINLVFPNQGEDDRGAHVNISGGGIAIHSKNKANAQRLLEFLVSEKAQSLYAKINYEYPVNESLELPEDLKLWGTFKEDQTSVSEIARLSVTAQKIIDRVGW